MTNDTGFETGESGRPLVRPLGQLVEVLPLLDLSREEFIERVTDDVPEKPADYEAVIAANSGKNTPNRDRQAAELDAGPNNCSA